MIKGGIQMKNNWIGYALALLSVMFILAACGGGTEKATTTSDGDKKTGTTEETKTYKIGVTQIVEHPSLDAAFDGFQKAIEDAGLERRI